MSTVSQASRKASLLVADPSRPEQVIPYLLKNLHHSIRQAVDEAFRVQRFEMSFAQFVALLMLELEAGLVGAELARRAYVTAQTMNTILRRMERDGDIERRPHPQKSRADSWFVTSAGQARLKKARTIGETVWLRLLSALKPAEINQLKSMLERCIRGMEEGTQEQAAARTAKAKRRTVKTKSSARRS
jgi:DNA-binding MarR family transcriptional regulator